MMDESRANSRATSVLDPDNIFINNDADFSDNAVSTPRVQLQDDDLKRLTKYFEDSRKELQKVRYI